MANEDIRKCAKEKKIHLYEIARLYGCNDGNFSRKLRFELSLNEKRKIMDIIDYIIEHKENGG